MMKIWVNIVQSKSESYNSGECLYDMKVKVFVSTEEQGQIPKLPSKDDKIKKYYLKKVLSLKDKGVYPCLDRYLDGRPQDYQDYSCL